MEIPAVRVQYRLHRQQRLERTKKGVGGHLKVIVTLSSFTERKSNTTDLLPGIELLVMEGSTSSVCSITLMEATSYFLVLLLWEVVLALFGRIAGLVHV